MQERMYNILNTVIVDVKVQPNTVVLDRVMNFTGSVKSGKYQLLDGSMRNRYTFIRIEYAADEDIPENIKRLIRPGSFVRVIGMLDSNPYKAKSGKTVYNKILRALDFQPIHYDYETKDFVVD